MNTPKLGVAVRLISRLHCRYTQTPTSYHGLLIKSSPRIFNTFFRPSSVSGFHSSASRGFFIPFDPTDTSDSSESSDNKQKSKFDLFKDVLFKSIETACITFASVSVIALAGYAYQKYYHRNAIQKMEMAFFPESLADSSSFSVSGTAHHPLLKSSADAHSRLLVNERPQEPSATTEALVEDEKAKQSEPSSKGSYTANSQELVVDEAATEEYPTWVERKQQKLLDDIIAGKISGRYYLLVGEKGTGKTSMILEAMRRSKGQFCTMLDAHPDPEIFRIRLGRALNFEFFEDYIGGMFSLRGPRDTTALLDIERAFNKLEHVAMEVKNKSGRPLVLVINNSHMIKDDESGTRLVELLQQKAESLAGAVTLIFNSDDYWVYERLKQLGTKLDVVTIRDMSREESIKALQLARHRVFGTFLPRKEADDVYNLVGGRPQHLASVAAALDYKKACHQLIDRERTWFLNQCGLLGEGMDDDVMESGKFSTSAMLLMRALVEMDREAGNQYNNTPEDKLKSDHSLPQVPLWIARRIMTRPDYIQRYDNLNIFTIDSNSYVRADSVPMMQAFHEIAAMPKFDDLLEETMDRVSAIESLGRTRELVAKDLVQKGGLYRFMQEDFTEEKANGSTKKKSSWVMKLEQPEEEEDDGENYESLNLNEERRHWWWKKRDAKFGRTSVDEARPPKN